MPKVRRGYVPVPWGQLHYAVCGEGPAIVLIHQTPRSWDEYRDVIPLLAARHLVIAPDTVGFGASDLPGGVTETIELYADGLTVLLGALDLADVIVVGHHTGALVALELAARQPTPVRALVLSSAPYKTPVERSDALAGPGIDDVVERADGTHLVELWQRRQSFYPADRRDLLRRLVTDALRAGDRAEEGHRAVNRYAVEDRVGRVSVPVLLLTAPDDPFAYPMVDRWRAALPGAALSEIPGGMVPLPDQLPAEFARAVEGFVDSIGP